MERDFKCKLSPRVNFSEFMPTARVYTRFRAAILPDCYLSGARFIWPLAAQDVDRGTAGVSLKFGFGWSVFQQRNRREQSGSVGLCLDRRRLRRGSISFPSPIQIARVARCRSPERGEIPGRWKTPGGGAELRSCQPATGFGSSASSLIQFFRSHAHTRARGPATAREICRPAEEFLAAPSSRGVGFRHPK